MLNDSVAYRAKWVFPIDHPPIRDGIVEVRAGRILAVGKYRASYKVRDLGDVALLPGLVNAHMHLEFSNIQQPLGDSGVAFSEWIKQVIAYRRGMEESQSPSQWRSGGVELGLQESWDAGVAVVGEIATDPWPVRLFDNSALRSVIFLELLGLAPERIEPLWQKARDHACSPSPNYITHALSPHAPYTVHPELFARVCELSGERKFPVAFHLAESLEEIELLSSGSGRLVELLEGLGAFPRGVIQRGTRPLDYLHQLAACQRALVVHGNYLAPDEIEYLGQRSERMSVVYCPRTHAKFNAGQYPLAEMLAANVNVCLGTDSRASNPDLRLWEDLRYVANNHPQVTLAGVLHMGTLAGAEALGLDDEFGSITAGKDATFSLVAISTRTVQDPHELLFVSETGALRPDTIREG